MPNTLRRLFAAAAMSVAASVSIPAWAQLASADVEDAARIEAWIESVETLSARFVQVAPDGAVSEGYFYLRRPGLMRFQYDPPVPMLIVADGFSVHLIDLELDEATSWPIIGTPLRPLLRKDIDFADNYLQVLLHSPGLLRLTLVELGELDQGSFTLVFQEEPFQLVQWVVIDAVGLTTVVGFSEMVLGAPIDGRLFTFDDPRHRQVEEP